MSLDDPIISKNKQRLALPCDTCPANCRPVRTRGKKRAKILVVSKGPRTPTQADLEQHMGDDALGIFLDTAEMNGFDETDFIFHSAIKCYFDDKTTPPQDKKWIKANCREYFLRAVEKAQPDIIIPLGVDAAVAVYGKGKKITKIRGMPEYLEDYDAWVYPMVDPTMVAMYPQQRGIFEADFRRLSALMENGFDIENATHDEPGDYRIVTDLQFIIDDDPSLLAFDIEAMGLRWIYNDKKILTMQFCYEEGKAYLLPWDHPDMPMSIRQKKRVKRQLRQILCNPERTIIGHNLKFDAVWVWHKLGIRFKVGGDTLNLCAIDDENLLTKDLSTLTKMYIPELAGYDDYFNQTYDKAHLELVDIDELRKYGCGDVDAVFRLFPILEDKVYNDDQLANYYETVTLSALNTFMSIERRGMPVNLDKLDDLEEELRDYIEELYQELIDEVPNSIKRQHLREHRSNDPREVLKFTRPQFVIDILFDHPDGFCLEPRVFTKTTKNLDPEFQVPSVSSKDHLPFFFEECPFTEKLAEWIKLNRLLDTNIVGFREKYVVDGCIYPTYTMDVTVTGRTSSRDPNGQNFPKRGRFAKTYRSIFLPPPGWVMLEADLSQAELRIAADMAGEPTMLDIYNSGGDIHRLTALIVSGLSESQFNQLPKDEQGLYRFKAKAVNFGFLYGMGWRKFIIYAKTQYAVDFTEAEAQRIRNGFFNTYSRLPRWHQAVRAFVRQHGFVRSYSGRVRHLPTINSSEEYIQQEAERQAINSPVQEFGSTLGVLAACRIDQNIDPNYLQIFGFVHDAVYAAAPPQYVEWGAKTMKYYMETVPIRDFFNLNMQCPIVADVSFGWDGGNQYEMDGLKLDETYNFRALEEELMDKGVITEPFNLPEQEIPPGRGEIEIPEHLRLHMVA